MDLPRPLKDLDVVVVVSQKQFKSVLKKVFGESYYKRYVSANKAMPSNYLNTLTMSEFMNYVKDLTSITNKTKDEEKLLQALKKGKIPDIDFLTREQIDVLNMIRDHYDLPDFDISVLQIGKAFEGRPFLSLN